MARESLWDGSGTESDGLITRPLRRFLVAYSLTLAGLLCFGLAFGEPGFEMLVVAMGWPHVLLGLLFYAQKLTPADSPYRRPFVLLLLLTLAISLTHTLVAITTLIYIYFVFHAFRDEIFIYRQRNTGFSFGGRVLDGSGIVFLTAILAIAASDQLSQLSWRPVYRSASIPVSEIDGDDVLEITFEPLGDSAGREYYLSLSVPKSPVGLTTYMTREDGETTGEMLVNEKSMDGTLHPGSRHDLYFEALYAGREREGGFRIDGDLHAATPLSGGHFIGQTFRAGADGLDGIALPIVWEDPLSRDRALEFTLGPAAAIRFPFFEEAGLLALVLAGGLVVVARSRRIGTLRRQEHYYFLVLIGLFLAAKLTLEVGRYYLFVAPLFFSFLVVFHYFSWYVFSLEKIGGGTGGGQTTSDGWIRWLARRMRTRSGFVRAVLGLNALSLAGVVAYQTMPDAGFLKYAFDLDYFLYFLVFHVTMSFAPRRLPEKG